MSSDPPPPRPSPADELSERIRAHGAELGEARAREILRHPFVDRRVIAELASHPSLMALHGVRSAVARHPKTPQDLAMRLVPTLFWRDLIEIGVNVRVSPLARRTAERMVIERLPGLAVGEKASAARRSSARVISALRHDPNPRVIAALLENPRLTEGTLMPLLVSESTRPAILAKIASDRRWGARYPVRLALAKNPRTPLTTALTLLAHLKKHDLVTVAAGPRVGSAVRRRARLLSGGAGRAVETTRR